jgi:hypothetical protein
MASINQERNSGLGHGHCLICGEVYSGKMRYMKVADRSELRKVHEACYLKKMTVNNTKVFGSSAVRSNGIINQAVLTITMNSDAVRDNLISYFVTNGYTYSDGNEKRTIQLITHEFSGMSSISKKLFNAVKKFNFNIKGFEIINLNDGTSYDISMKSAKNTDYTEAVRLFNAKKFEKLQAWLEARN